LKPLLDGIVGARPNMMKMAPLAKALADDGGFDLRIVHTGQHYDFQMSGVFLRELGLPEPFVNLDAGAESSGQDDQTAAIIERYGRFLDENGSPGGVIVVGDVNSTLACSIVAAKRRIPIAHVEAGLRSFDRTMPEEINRIVCDSLSSVLLVSEESGMKNLEREGHAPDMIHYVGNIMIDSLKDALKRAGGSGIHARCGVKPGRYAYLTLHRPSNVDDPEILRSLLQTFNELSRDRPIVFAVHPRTRKQIDRLRISLQSANVITCEPLGYMDSLALMRDAWAVMTDSGGMQEECSVLEVPCLTLRFNTERPVTTTLGTSELVGNDPHLIRDAWERLSRGEWRKAAPIPLWDGRTAGRIVDVLKREWL